MKPTRTSVNSLADQTENAQSPPSSNTLAIALGANLPSAIGPPSSTLQAVRPMLRTTVEEWITFSLKASTETELEINLADLHWRWSPLFETDPVGGPNEQPPYLNAVVLIQGPQLAALPPTEENALKLLERFLSLEKHFGRERSSSLMGWQPRSLDIDLLAWGGLQLQHENLILPHPRLIERSFVVVPLSAVLIQGENAPRRIPPHLNWPE